MARLSSGRRTRECRRVVRLWADGGGGSAFVVSPTASAFASPTSGRVGAGSGADHRDFFAPGSRVLALNNRGQWRDATVTRVTSDGACSVRYDEGGDFDFGLPLARLKPGV